MTTTWDKICRICSSPAHNSVFSKIPAYIHESPEVAINWQRPICDMLRDITGLQITRNDGLPSCICAVCISYLKHAVTFQDRALNNARSLRSVLLLAGTTTVINTDERKCDNNNLKEIKKDYDETMKSIAGHYKLLNFNSTIGICKVNKELFSKYWQVEITNPPTEQEITFNLRELALLFRERREDKRMAAYKKKYENAQFEQNTCLGNNSENDDADGDDDNYCNNNNIDDGEIISATAGECLFSYKEKHFQEDDVMEQANLLNSVCIKEPENCYERKCRACNYRFLLEQSFSQHLELCVEYKFLLLVEELNLLLNIRRRKAISPHEYMRRFIFCLRKTCDWLAQNCDESLPLPTGRGTKDKRRRSEGDGCQITETKKSTMTIKTLNNGACFKEEEEDKADVESKELQSTIAIPNKKTRRGGKRHNKSRTKSSEDDDELVKITSMTSNDDQHALKMLEMQNKLREVFSITNASTETTAIEIKDVTPTNTEIRDKMQCNKVINFENIWQNAVKTMPIGNSEIRPIQSPPPQDKGQTFLLRPKARYSIQSPPASSLPVPFMVMPQERQQLKNGTNDYAAHCAACNMCFDTLRHFEIHIADIHNKNYNNNDN